MIKMLNKIKNEFETKKIMDDIYLKTTPYVSKSFRINYPEFKTELHYIPKDESLEIYLIDKNDINSQYVIQVKDKKVKFINLKEK